MDLLKINFTRNMFPKIEFFGKIGYNDEDEFFERNGKHLSLFNRLLWNLTKKKWDAGDGWNTGMSGFVFVKITKRRQTIQVVYVVDNVSHIEKHDKPDTFGDISKIIVHLKSGARHVITGEPYIYHAIDEKFPWK